MTVILDGKETANKIYSELTEKIAQLKTNHNIIPGLAVILVGDNAASKAYVSRKEKMAKTLGIHSRQIILDKDISENQLKNTIQELNSDPSIHGILVQLPLPKHINTENILGVIDPNKDVDGFHPLNMGKLLSGSNPMAYPCTPLGIIKLLKAYDIKIEGKKAVIIGRSNIVGKPISIMLLNENATITVCHSKTQNIDEHCKKADIIIVAIGKPNFLKSDWVKEGSIVIDVGINKDPDTGKICGDVDFNNVSPLTSYITPVPGGVGPMTIAMLMYSTVKLCINTTIKETIQCY